MTVLFNIRTITFYEIKSLKRSTIFKTFLALQGLLLLWLLFTFLRMGTFRSIHAFPPITPYIFTIYLNVFQTIAFIFVTSHVFHSDSMQDSTKALYPRPFLNIGYVLGKVLGIVALFVITDIFCYSLLLVFHSVFLKSQPVFTTYIFYPLIIIFPTMIFTCGLAAWMVVMFRNQVITIVLLLGLILSLFTITGIRYPFLDDITGTNLPLFYSQFTGFGNAFSISLQRGMYVVLGLGFVLFAGVFYSRNRLTQSIRMNITTFCLAALCFICAGYAGKMYLYNQFTGRELRNRMRAIEQTMPESSPLMLSDCRLDLVHTDDSIAVVSNLCIKNISQQAVDTYTFRLNPGLDVQSVEQNGQIVPFERKIHILSINPSISLNPGEIDSLKITYSGTIDENACYIDIDEKQHERPNRKLRMTIDKRYSFITPEYVLLTQECNWYPTPFKLAKPREFILPRRDFTHFQLTVNTDSTLTAISQGEPVITAPGHFSFAPEYPLTQISLVIGDYTKQSTTVDGIEYGVYARKGNDYTRGLEKLTEKKLHEAIKDLKREYEFEIHLPYPFHRLYLVEVPVQFLAYNRDWNLTPDFVQPEQVFINEKGFLSMDYPFYKISGNMNETTIKTEGEKQYNKFNTSIKGLILGSSRRYAIGQRDRFNAKSISLTVDNYSTILPSFSYNYNIYPNLYPYAYYLSSEKHPFIDLLMQYYLRSKLGYGGYAVYEWMYGAAREDVITYKLSSRFTVNELLEKPEYSYIMPNILKSKTDALFAALQIKAGMSHEEFDAFLEDFLAENRFESIPAEKMFEKLPSDAMTNMSEYFDDWQNNTKLPKFSISDAYYTPIVIDNKEQIFYSFAVQNCGEASGVIQTEIQDLDNFQNTVIKLILLEKNQAKRIGIISQVKSYHYQIAFRTRNALNKRVFWATPRKKRIKKSEIFEGERIINVPVQSTSPDTIIVDNADPGFQIVSQPQLGFIRRLLANDKPEMIELVGFNYRSPSQRWREGVADYFYGNMETSARYTAAGNGSGKVAWTALITEPGEYDVYYYTPPPNQMLEPHPFKEIYTVQDLHFIINDDTGTHDVVLEADKTNQRWSLIGTYSFSDTTSTIELTNQSKGRTVYADAVKWVKK